MPSRAWWLRLNDVLDRLETSDKTTAWVESMGETAEGYSRSLLQLARMGRSTDGLAVAVMYIERVRTKASVVDIAVALVYEDWHHHYASLLRLLNGLDGEAVLDALEELARNKPATEEVDADSVANQAVRAIANHPSLRARQVLRGLAKSARPAAQQQALAELERLA